jgi:hypothetical protein
MSKYNMPWHVSDREWFKNNPKRSFRIREAFSGEPALHGGEKFSSRLRVIVRRIENELYTGIAFIYPAIVADNDEALGSFYQNLKSYRIKNGRRHQTRSFKTCYNRYGYPSIKAQ